MALFAGKENELPGSVSTSQLACVKSSSLADQQQQVSSTTTYEPCTPSLQQVPATPGDSMMTQATPAHVHTPAPCSSSHSEYHISTEEEEAAAEAHTEDSGEWEPEVFDP